MGTGIFTTVKQAKKPAWHKNKRRQRCRAKRLLRRVKYVPRTPREQTALKILRRHHGCHLFQGMAPSWYCGSCGGKNDMKHEWCAKFWKGLRKDSKLAPWNQKDEGAGGKGGGGKPPRRSKSLDAELRSARQLASSNHLPEGLKQAASE